MPCQVGDVVDLVPMELSEMPKNRFAAHVLAVFDVGNISIRQRSLVRFAFFYCLYLLQVRRKDTLYYFIYLFISTP